MDETPDDGGVLRYLKGLVTILSVVMICGVLAITVTLVIRLRAPAPPLPSEISLPGGARATALTQGDTWYAVVTDADEILIFDRLTGALRQRVRVNTAH